MELRNRLYPYPVLSNYNDDYKDSVFDINIESYPKNDKIVIRAEVVLQNDEMKELIKKNTCAFAIHVECPMTNFRNMELFNDYVYEFDIPENKVNDNLEVCTFIIANKNIELYKNKSFNTYFEGLTFDIEKYNILAIGSQNRIPIEKDYDELKNISSIFSVVPNFNENQPYILKDYNNDKIIIKVPHEEFVLYKQISLTPTFNSVMQSMFLLPILNEIIMILQKEDWYEYEDKRWFKTIEKTVIDIGYDFSKEELCNKQSFLLAQELLKSPTIRALNDIYLIASGDFKGDEADEY